MTRNEDIRFSILVPVYNAQDFLAECVDSVLNQTYQNYEIVLVDDGSTDNSGTICDDYALRCPQISVYHKENVGQLHTRKYALDRAKGDFCVYLDSDDYLEANALELLHHMITTHDCDCVIYGMKRVKDGKVIEVICDKEDAVITDKRELYRRCLLSFAYNSVCSKCVKTSILQGIDHSSYFHIKHGEDLIQSLDVLKISQCVVFVKEALYNYRYNYTSVTQTITFEKYNRDNSVRERVLEFLREEQVFNEADFVDYRTLCVRVWVRKLEVISKFDIDIQQKISVFEELKRSPYYTEFINAGPYHKKVLGYGAYLFGMFRAGRYKLLVRTVRLLSKIKGG